MINFAGFSILVTYITVNRNIFYCKEIPVHKAPAFGH